MRPGSIWLGRDKGPALPSEALALSLPPGAIVCRLHRLRTADDVVMALEHSIVPSRFLADPDLVGDSLYAELKVRGTVPIRALQRMRAMVADEEQAKRLGVDEGAPLLAMERCCFDREGQAVEYCHSVYRGELYDLLVELMI